VHEGAFWIDPAVAAQIKTYLQQGRQAISSEDAIEPLDPIKAEGLKTLTEREQEILGLIAEGRKNQEIADLLCISPGTVRVHVHSILNKLNVKDRTQAAVFLMKKQL
jgi:two-component system, NarL family, response regulator